MYEFMLHFIICTCLHIKAQIQAIIGNKPARAKATHIYIYIYIYIHAYMPYFHTPTHVCMYIRQR
jgi:hypothetical protein